MRCASYTITLTSMELWIPLIVGGYVLPPMIRGIKSLGRETLGRISETWAARNAAAEDARRKRMEWLLSSPESRHAYRLLAAGAQSATNMAAIVSMILAVHNHQLSLSPSPATPPYIPYIYQ